MESPFIRKFKQKIKKGSNNINISESQPVDKVVKPTQVYDYNFKLKQVPYTPRKNTPFLRGGYAIVNRNSLQTNSLEVTYKRPNVTLRSNSTRRDRSPGSPYWIKQFSPRNELHSSILRYK